MPTIKAANIAEAKAQIEQHDPDLVFLDVEMPLMSGLELLDSLDDKPQVILVTARERYAVEAFEYDVTDYLLKPPNFGRFLKAVRKAVEFAREKTQAAQIDVASAEEPQRNEIYVKKDGCLVKVPYSNISYVEALADYAVIHASGKRYTVHSTMKGISEKLGDREFMRVHRSYIINLNRVDQIEDNTVVMGENLLPVGGSYRNKLLGRLNLV